MITSYDINERRSVLFPYVCSDGMRTFFKLTTGNRCWCSVCLFLFGLFVYPRRPHVNDLAIKKINNTLQFGPLNSTARPVVNFKIDDVHTFQWWTNECLSFHSRLDSLPYTHQIARNLFWIPLAFHWARNKNTKSWQNLRSWSGPTDMNDDALTNFSSIWIILWLDSSFAYYTLSRCMYILCM